MEHLLMTLPYKPMSFSFKPISDYLQPESECVKPTINPENKIEIVTASLSDCLACTGCITSAETVLFQSQSVKTFQEALASKKQVVVTLCPQAVSSFAAKAGLEYSRAKNKLCAFFKSLGVCRVYDLSASGIITLQKCYSEFLLRRGSTRPLLSSICPGWVCYCEKKFPELIPHNSLIKPPHQIMGAIIKLYPSLGGRMPACFHTIIVTCHEKKLESKRDQFHNERIDASYVDCALATIEIENLILATGTDLSLLEPRECDQLVPGHLAMPTGSSSGGYVEYIFKNAVVDLFEGDVEIRTIEKTSGLVEFTAFQNGSPVLCCAAVHGFKNIQNLIKNIQAGRNKYDYVEVMACPSSCISGGGQLKDPTLPIKDFLNKSSKAYQEACKPDISSSSLSKMVTWLDDNDLFTTSFRPVEKKQVGIVTNW